MTFYDFRADKSSEIIKEKLEQKSPKIKFGYGLTNHTEGISNLETVIYGIPKSAEQNHCGIFPIIIENIGERAAENISFSLTLSAAAGRGTDILGFKFGVGIMPGLIRECFYVDDLVRIDYLIPLLNPNAPLIIEEPFWIEKTVNANLLSKVPTSERKKLPDKIEFTFGLIFTMKLGHKEASRSERRLNIFIMQEENINQLEAISKIIA